MAGTTRAAKRARPDPPSWRPDQPSPPPSPTHSKRRSKRQRKISPPAEDENIPVELPIVSTAELFDSNQVAHVQRKDPEQKTTVAPAVDEATRDAILRLTTLRLVWSRREMEELQTKLNELGKALVAVDDLHRHLAM
jgi:hypothetical protein